jgi:hypothetical protein
MFFPVSENYIHEEVKDSLNSFNVCCYLYQNLSSSRVLSKNVNMKVQRFFDCDP